MFSNGSDSNHITFSDSMSGIAQDSLAAVVAAQEISWRGLVLKSALLIALFTALAGLGDAKGFIHASRVWQDGSFVWIEAFKCIAGFQLGMLMYWLALWKLSGSGITAVEIQTLFWFVATIVGVALMSGRMLSWPAFDQVVAICILTGMGWLLYRGSSLS